MTDTMLKDPFGDDDEADDIAASFAPKPKTEAAAPAAKSAAIKAADATAEKQGFTARRKPKKSTYRRSDNFRTGRNEHIGVKGRKEDKERLAAISEDRGWVNGQTLQYALEALLEKINNPQDNFWETRNFHGVD